MLKDEILKNLIKNRTKKRKDSHQLKLTRRTCDLDHETMIIL
jgi:hypothetical protein